MSTSLYTIGYEGCEIGQFLATLQIATIEHVLDIRDVPVSRKRGFSKNTLSQALREIGIDSTHLKSLGDPKSGRDAMKRGDYEGFIRIYQNHLAQKEAQDALNIAIKIAEETKSVLLCYERAPGHCHRSIVARNMAEREAFSVHHIGVNPLLLRNGASPSTPNPIRLSHIIS